MFEDENGRVLYNEHLPLCVPDDMKEMDELVAEYRAEQAIADAELAAAEYITEHDEFINQDPTNPHYY